MSQFSPEHHVESTHRRHNAEYPHAISCRSSDVRSPDELDPIRIETSEQKYLDALSEIVHLGELKSNRTGIKTYQLFGFMFRYNLLDGFPLFTTKYVSFRTVLKELLFFISGGTDTTVLENQGVTIWKGNTSRAFLDQRELFTLPENDMGLGYGWQWRSWNAPRDHPEKGIDQLANLIDGIRTDPFSRRHVMTAWNPAQLNAAALPPCHILFQVNVSSDKKFIDGLLYQRSADMFLGVPFNVASYACLLHMIGNLVGMKPRHFVHQIGDAHIYENHIHAADTQIDRVPLPYPTLSLVNASSVRTIDGYNVDHFVITKYEHHPSIRASMAV